MCEVRLTTHLADAADPGGGEWCAEESGSPLTSMGGADAAAMGVTARGKRQRRGAAESSGRQPDASSVRVLRQVLVEVAVALADGDEDAPADERHPGHQHPERAGTC